MLCDVELTGCSAVHVSGVLEELCCTPQWTYVGALLELKCHFSNKVQKPVGLSQVLAKWGNVPEGWRRGVAGMR